MKKNYDTEQNSKQCKEWYERNKEKRRIFVLARQKRILDEVQSYKLASGCQVCGYNKSARALQFHHIESSTKEGNIARWVTQGHSIEKIMGEIAKCICVCANCHFEIHEAEHLASQELAIDTYSEPRPSAGEQAEAEHSEELRAFVEDLREHGLPSP